MMKLYRIKALISRALLITFRGIDPLVDFFYWPFYDILVWGFTAKWVQINQPALADTNLALLGCLVLWQASLRANFDVSFNFLAELWARNIVNLFATPLKINEWIFSVLILGLINTTVAVSFGMFAVWMLYDVSVLRIGWPLIPFSISLIFSGWAIGFFTASTLAYWGQKVQKLVWVMSWFFVPFSAVFYPVEILPHWAQLIAKALPMTYIFESVRSYVNTGTFSVNYLIISFVLNALYFIIALMLFKWAFRSSRVKGLARLELE